MVSPPVAAVTVLIAGAMTPGYDPMSRTISRLAVPGISSAAAVDGAIFLIAIACLALSVELGRGAATARAALLLASAGLGAAAIFHLDPASVVATAVHRIVSGVAVVSLAVAPFAVARTYGRISLAAGLATLAMLVIALGLLATSFNAWGAWERALLAIPLSWIVFVSARLNSTASAIPSREEIVRTSAASVSNSGS